MSLLTFLLHRIETRPRAFESVTPTQLTELLDIMVARGVRPRPLRDAQLDGVSLTFDDGNDSDTTIVLPELLKRGFGATFFVIADEIGTPGRATADDLRTLVAAGMEVGSHTTTHRWLTEIAPTEAREELESSKASLESLLGIPINSLSFPGGYHSRRLVSLAQATGYTHIATSRPAATGPSSRTIGRVNIHSRTTTKDVERILDRSRQRLLRMQASYAVRAVAKRVVGIDRYARVKTWFVGLR